MSFLGPLGFWPVKGRPRIWTLAVIFLPTFTNHLCNNHTFFFVAFVCVIEPVIVGPVLQLLLCGIFLTWALIALLNHCIIIDHDIVRAQGSKVIVLLYMFMKALDGHSNGSGHSTDSVVST